MIENLNNKASTISRAGKVAVVHDWCPDFRGGERVLSEICDLFSSSDVFTLFYFLDDAEKREHFPSANFFTSPLNRLPFVKRYYRALFFLCPFMLEQFNVTEYDLIVSSSAAFARGVLTRPDQPHVCYVHTPPRYAWDEQFAYLQHAGLGFGPRGLLFRYMLHRLRAWDARTAHGPDILLANSSYVKGRIKRIYGRDATVVFPPVQIDEFPLIAEKDDYYVTAAFLAPYKRTDLVVRAFREMPSRRLVVVGAGQHLPALQALSAPNITFTGFLPRSRYIDVVSQARAFVFAGCEDFGIALAEAQASGTPLIAFDRGGAQDIVRPLGRASEPTGVMFPAQTVDAVRAAVEHFETRRSAISPDSCRRNAARFSPKEFRQKFLMSIETAFRRHQITPPSSLTSSLSDHVIVPYPISDIQYAPIE